MKRKYVLLLVLNCVFIYSFSQASFVKGYFINNEDVKTECLIQNKDWGNNPTKITVKADEASESISYSLDDVIEFGVSNESKYIRSEVDIDRSPKDLNHLSNEKKPEFNKEILFLKVLIEGKISLFQYMQQNLVRYFITNENGEIIQLVYKLYSYKPRKTLENNYYKQQLIYYLQNAGISVEEINKLNYAQGDLLRIIKKYNENFNVEVNIYEEKRKLLHVDFMLGLAKSSLSIDNNASDNMYIDFGEMYNMKFGIETEFIIPYNFNRWSFLIGASYQYFSGSAEWNYREVNAYYRSIEIPFTARNYFFPTKKSKIYIDGSLILDSSINSMIDFELGEDLKTSICLNSSIGIGYKYNDKLGLEFKYYRTKNIFTFYADWTSEMNNMALQLVYTL